MKLNDFAGRNALTYSTTITGKQAESLMDMFMPKVEPRYYIQWSTGKHDFRALLTLDEAQALGRGEKVELPGLELNMYGTWIPCPRTNEALMAAWYLTGQYVESDEPPDTAP